MPSYNSTHTGIQIDDTIARIITAENSGGIVNGNTLTTTLQSYLTTANAASTYLSQTDAQNYALKSTVVTHDNYFTSADLIGSDMPADRYCQFNIPITATGRTGCKAGKDYLQICFTTTGIVLYVRDASSGSWTAAWSK